MMNWKSFFNYENQFFYVLGKIADGFFLSVLWLLFCIPVVTAGASTTALYETAHRVLRRNQGYIWVTFWENFRSNLKQTVKIWLILLALFVFLIYDRSFIFVNFIQKGSGMGILYYFFSFAIMFVAVWAIYIFAYSARFEMDMKNTMKNAAMIAVANLPWSLLVLLILIAAICIVLRISPFWLTALPAVLGCLYDLILEKVFRKYMSEEDLRRQKELDKG